MKYPQERIIEELEKAKTGGLAKKEISSLIRLSERQTLRHLKKMISDRKVERRENRYFLKKYGLEKTMLRKLKKKLQQSIETKPLKKGRKTDSFPIIKFEELSWDKRADIITYILRKIREESEFSPDIIFTILERDSKYYSFKIKNGFSRIKINNNNKAFIKDFLDYLVCAGILKNIDSNLYMKLSTAKKFVYYHLSEEDYDKNLDVGIFLSSLLFLLFSYILVTIFPFITSDWYVWKVWNEIYFLLFLTWLLLLIVILLIRRKKILDYYIIPIFKFIRRNR